MTFASDQNTNPKQLSETSQRMLQLREDVFTEWERRVRASVSQAGELRHPILINTLPAFYDNIAEAVTDNYPRLSAGGGNSLAAEHGGERARLTIYDHQALIAEYQIFRWTIFDLLHHNDLKLTHREILAINASIDDGIKEAVNAFALVHSAFRERFIAALTHDLRGPLNAANMAAELIMLASDPAKMKVYAARIIDNIRHTDMLIQEMLDTMAFQGGNHIPLNLTNFDILEVVKEVQTQAIAVHGPRLHVIGVSVWGWWDRGAMRRAIENVIGNAVKYGDPNTPITVKIDEVHERLLLSVHNEGQPIPPEDLECIFQMFRRSKTAREGSKSGWGVGLPYVRSVAESHGGSIGVDSTLERGTTFAIDIPVDTRQTPNAPTLSAS